LNTFRTIFPAGSAAFHGGLPVRENGAEMYGSQERRGVVKSDVKDKFEFYVVKKMSIN